MVVDLGICRQNCDFVGPFNLTISYINTVETMG